MNTTNFFNKLIEFWCMWQMIWNEYYHKKFWLSYWNFKTYRTQKCSLKVHKWFVILTAHVILIFFFVFLDYESLPKVYECYVKDITIFSHWSNGFWYFMKLIKVRLRYTNGLKRMLPHHCLIKLLEIYYIRGLRKFHFSYTNGL